MKKSSTLSALSVMRKTVPIFVLLLMFAPATSALGSTAHRGVARAAYDELPENIRARLNLSTILDGSTLPDRDRAKYDHYATDATYVRSRASEWLERARGSYGRSDFYEASLCLGIASHFISDAASLPHSIDGETPEEHDEFEGQGNLLQPERPVLISSFDWEENLRRYSEGASTKWQQWLNTHDQSIVQEGIDLAASCTYNAWYRVLETEPVAEPVWLILWVGVGAMTIVVVTTATVAVRRRRLRWYLYQDGRRYGPVNTKVLHRWIGEGRVKRGALIWRKGMEGWRKIEETERFKSRFP